MCVGNCQQQSMFKLRKNSLFLNWHLTSLFYFVALGAVLCIICGISVILIPREFFRQQLFHVV